MILDVVLAETDYMLRERVGAASARALLDAVAGGTHTAAYLSPGLLSRAAELDAQYADLGLGLVDASIMAYAERHRLPILSFDFRDFRATDLRRRPLAPGAQRAAARPVGASLSVRSGTGLTTLMVSCPRATPTSPTART